MRLKLIAFIVLFGSVLLASAQKPVRPNIVFFLIDDMGWADAATYGSTFYETPNIDKLAKAGMKFTSAYAACPVCSPTRASIMTGKYPASMQTTDWFGAPQPEEAANDKNWSRKKLLPASYKAQLPLEEVTIAEALKANGYKTFIAGKWHLGENEKYWPENQGFDINKGGFSKGHPSSYFSPYKNPRLTDGPAGEYLGDRVAAETSLFIEQHKNSPFFAYVSFYEAHTPMQAKDSLIKKYEAKKQSLNLADAFLPEGARKNRTVQCLPVYAAMLESMDHAIGTVIDKLKAEGLEDNTIVVFFSDNGGLSTAEGAPTSNLPLRAGKGWLYEGGIREPMIIKYPPKINQGTVCDVPVISNDFYPTLLQLANLPLMPGQHTGGISLTPVFANKKIKRAALYWHYPHYGNQGGSPGAAMRMGKWKLIEWYEHNTVELFDLEKDMGEQSNVANDFPGVKTKMLDMLHDWQKKEAAAMPTNNPAAGKSALSSNNSNTDTSYIADILTELRKKWPKNRNINLVFHGHSVPSGYYRAGQVNIFESYPMQALKKITQQYNYATVNCIKTSIGGENAEQGAERFESTVLVHQPDVLFIDYALNDRKMGLERSKIAWERMIEKALAKNIKIVLLTPTPDLNEDIKSDDTALEKFSAQITELAKKYNLALIDSYHIFKLLAEKGIDLNAYMSQNNHPNEKGHQLVADEICKLFAIQ
jgi:arylsulfatase A-like enzyme/lysophospholipase L1-like esterase